MSKIKFHHLKPTPGSSKSKLRKGRGESGKRGKTAGRGTKGTGARKTVPAYFEGGQIPLYRRIPKLKGLKNTPKMSYVVVNVSDLQEKNLKGDIDPDVLQQNGLTRKKGLVKVLGNGDITNTVNIKVHAVSESAKKKIEDAGGTVEVIEV
ncbi:MAG: 50S ribosomal protein L15 [Candidatus Actinomarina sp.]|jgi:large subunit ribosomal protein L15|nr:50S ribosomal protein L15 [Actinomycetota bacterium]MDC3033262.1 50S ribosomal protein L15 [Acidimicrobiaceae bacterium]MDC3226668.1 50S ribosomal protein L15 [Acidimicrobiaceae bacterium]|tara:strand:- start:6459 stop:6908 length:450 start_codon:yes stop_codon:yes gene_type:complete